MGKVHLTGVRFTDIDLIPAMKLAVRSHMEAYQGDFYDYDMPSLKEAVGSTDSEDRHLIWMCRRQGTWLLRERDVFIRDSHGNVTCRFYYEQRIGGVLIYVLDVERKEGGRLFGDIAVLDYGDYCRHVIGTAVRPGGVRIVFEHGETVLPPYDPIPRSDSRMGDLRSYGLIPESEGELSHILAGERRMRKGFRQGADFMACIKAA